MKMLSSVPRDSSMQNSLLDDPIYSRHNDILILTVCSRKVYLCRDTDGSSLFSFPFYLLASLTVLSSHARFIVCPSIKYKARD